MQNDIAEHVKQCNSCKQYKFHAQPSYGLMRMKFYDRPGRTVCIDVVELHVRTAEGNVCVLTFLDPFSHWVAAYPMKDQLASTVAYFFLQWCSENGLPEVVCHDRGTNFLSELMTELFKLLSIHGAALAAWSPRGNRVERWHRWVGAALRILFNEFELEVEHSLWIIMWIYRSTECAVTKMTPFLVHKGREARFPMDVMTGEVQHCSASDYVADTRETLVRVYERAKVAQMRTQEDSARYFNQHHGILHVHKPGDDVFIAQKRRGTGVTAKQLPQCSGPWKVLRCSVSNAYVRHRTTGEKKSVNLQYVRKAASNARESGDISKRESEIETGMVVPIRLTRKTVHDKKWCMAEVQQVHADQKYWYVQWYNLKPTNSNNARNMLTDEHVPVWQVTDEKGDVEEVYSKNKPAGAVAVTGVVNVKKIVMPGILKQEFSGKLGRKQKAALRVLNL